jgi:beta-glucanase (GH16 family)
VLTWLVIPVSVHTETLIAHPVSENLIWDEKFTPNGVQSKPDPASWTYDTGNGGLGGLQIYCAWAAGKPPCDQSQPNSFVGSDGYLHITARRPAPGVYTSARLKTQNLKSFQYGRVEARIQLPSGQGMWPAFWMIGDNISRVSSPACGEIDIMENLGASQEVITSRFTARVINEKVLVQRRCCQADYGFLTASISME